MAEFFDLGTQVVPYSLPHGHNHRHINYRTNKIKHEEPRAPESHGSRNRPGQKPRNGYEAGAEAKKFRPEARDRFPDKISFKAYSHQTQEKQRQNQHTHGDEGSVILPKKAIHGK